MDIKLDRSTTIRTAAFCVLALLLMSLLWAQNTPPAAPVAAAATAMKPAVALVARVTGTATYTDYAKGEEGRIEPKMKFKQGVTINTAADSTVVLLFSNGSSLTIKPETSISIEEYLQAPIPEDSPSLDSLDKEPTTSKTKLRLLEGDIIGSVKKLNTDEGSSYEVDSPIGTAGIRGTTFEFSTKIRGQGGPQGNFGLGRGFGFFRPTGRGPQDVGALDLLTFKGTLNPDGSVSITDIQVGKMSITLANSINLTAEQAEQFFAEFGITDFNPNQAGVQGGDIQKIITPGDPPLRVTPEQGENSNFRPGFNRGGSGGGSITPGHGGDQ